MIVRFFLFKFLLLKLYAKKAYTATSFVCNQYKLNMTEYIQVRGAKEHNLKKINVNIPKNKLVVITGLSGSGKSSLAFDTIYAEGQRRYVESLSSYAKQFLHMQKKPALDSITGLSPTIAIDQKTTSKNPRSTVGTMTEIYDYMRLLFARVGKPHSPTTGIPIESQTSHEILTTVSQLPLGTKIMILAPIARQAKGEFKREFLQARINGYQQVFVNTQQHNLEVIPKIEPSKKHDIEIVVDQLEIGSNIFNRLEESLEKALAIGDGIVYIYIVSLPKGVSTDIKVKSKLLFSKKYSCPVSGFQLPELEPRIFSFNSPFGACNNCHGLGKEKKFSPHLIVLDNSVSINDGAIIPWRNSTSKVVMQTLESLAKHYAFSLDKAFGEYSQEIQDILFYGSGSEEITFEYYDGRHVKNVKQPFAGIIPSLEEKLKKYDTNGVRDDLSKYLYDTTCQKCMGYRLNDQALCVKIDGLHIGELTSKSIAETYKWCNELTNKVSSKDKQIAGKIVDSIMARLQFLYNVGLDYLTLARKSPSLSGGENQRIRLASQIGSGLCNVIYVLDEPSIGLHQRDNNRLINTLKSLRDLGNTVIVVEHDDDTMHAADYIIDIGPGAGINGGNIISQGTVQDIISDSKSITGQYLSNKKFITIPHSKRRNIDGTSIILKGAKANNLQNIDVRIPLKAFTAVTGVSGSGKSSLIIHTFYKAISKKLELSMVNCGAYKSIAGLDNIDKIIDINQSPIGRTPRSNPATYTGVFTNIRDWFAELPASQARGYKVSRFSFNVKGGRCETCQSDGFIKIEMHFLPDIYVECDTCGGSRYNNETLEIKYKNKSIANVLTMTVDEAMYFFKEVPVIHDKLETLHKVGLGYIKIGQPATTLSGGEAQRVKLAKELSKKSTGKTLYILDEPTTGLHADDIRKLLLVLHQLVDRGNTVLVIEHNMDVIKTADYVIDIGPEGGDKGGQLVIAGTPETVAECNESHTGKYLKPHIQKLKLFNKAKATVETC